ncbi:uncharacterized protein PAF06_016341 [Gastrophryne carolinensis]
MRTWIDPVVAGSQLSSSFYETTLILVVKGYYNQSIPSNSSSEDELQKSISNFYIIYNLIIKLTPLPSAYLLAKFGDTKSRKVSLCVPLVGYFVSSLFLLFVILWDWPIQVMFGTAAFNGLCGWFTAFWPAVMALASLNSSEKNRSLRLIIIECTFGLAGFIGSLISGHIFVHLRFENHQGTVLVCCSLVGYAFCLIYIGFILKISLENKVETTSRVVEDRNEDKAEEETVTEHSRLINPTHQQSGMNLTVSNTTLCFFFLSATLYNSAVNGAEDVINFFVLKKPLSWGPVEVGYGNAAAYLVFITSFLGVLAFSRFMKDLSLVIFGMFSFFAGILIMAFVQQTYLYYVARVAMMFSLIPLPTIRAILSKCTNQSSYGKLFALLQIVMGVVAVGTSAAYITIYQTTLDWFSGFIFIVIFFIAFISFIPIRSLQQLDLALSKLEDQENCSRRYNFRVRGLPVMDLDPVTQELLRSLLPNVEERQFLLYSVHRALTLPRQDLLSKPHYFSTKEQLMAEAYGMSEIKLFADLEPVTIQKRREMKPLLAKLIQRKMKYWVWMWTCFNHKTWTVQRVYTEGWYSKSSLFTLGTMEVARTWIEPVVAGAQIASSFYDTALLMVVRNHYNMTINHRLTSSNASMDDILQKAISNFYIIYNVIMGLTPFLSAYYLAKIGDRTNRKVTICVPLLGYLISRMLLLFVIIWEWPIEVMFGSAALNGLTGWFTTYWAGVMAWASLCSSERRRSLRLIIIEMVYGLAGFVGSLVSGHIFVNLNITNHEGSILVCCSSGCYAFCFVYSLFVLRTPEEDSSETRPLLKDNSNTTVQAEDESAHALPSKLILITMFTSAIVFNIAFTATDDVINVFVLKAPLSWGPVDVGYGNAAAYMTCLTSFLGVFIFNKCTGDLGLIAIGIVSFSSGLLIMAFVQHTYMYYVARIAMMFSLIPTPTIRSVISKQIQGSSYGKVFVVLQLAIEIVAVSASAGFNKLYQATLDWYSGFCFLIFGSLGFLSIIPIGIAACKNYTEQQTIRRMSNQCQVPEES